MFEVYSKPGCSYCEKAKNLLIQKNFPYVEFILDVGQDKTPGFEYYTKDKLLEIFPGARTVPQIIYRAEPETTEATSVIGTYENLVNYLSQTADVELAKAS